MQLTLCVLEQSRFSCSGAFLASPLAKGGLRGVEPLRNNTLCSNPRRSKLMGDKLALRICSQMIGWQAIVIYSFAARPYLKRTLLSRSDKHSRSGHVSRAPTQSQPAPELPGVATGPRIIRKMRPCAASSPNQPEPIAAWQPLVGEA